VRSWFEQHRRALGQALARFAAAPLTTLLGALVVGITLALPAGGEMLLASVLAFGRHVGGTPEISLFLALEASAEDVAAIDGRLRNQAAVREFRFVPREEALARFRASEALRDVIDELPANPFPDAFVLTPREDAAARLDALREEAAAWPRVAHVQLDSQWARRLDALLAAGRATVLLLAGLLGAAIVAVSFNTIRLQILTQRAEIEVSRLLGATDRYIRRPFYYFGMMQALLGAAVAWLIVAGAAVALREPFAALARLYGMELALAPLPLAQSLLLAGFAALLGWIGARLSVARHLAGREGG
jgi:cell division transport system permease protein